MTAGPELLRAMLRSALSAAMKNKDRVAVNAIRSVLASIDNAEAVDESLAPAIEPGRIAGGVSGLARGEVPRRAITEQDAREIVQKAVAERRATAAQCDALKRHREADRLRAEIAVLSRFLDG